MVNRTDQAPRWIKMLPEATTRHLQSVIADLSGSPAVLPGSLSSCSGEPDMPVVR